MFVKSGSFFIIYLIIYIVLDSIGYRFSGGFYKPTCANVAFEDSMLGVETVVGIVFIAYTFYALICAYSGLSRKGMNLEMRTMIFRRQVTFHLLMVISNTLYIIASARMWFYKLGNWPNSQNLKDSTWRDSHDEIIF